MPATRRTVASHPAEARPSTVCSRAPPSSGESRIVGRPVDATVNAAMTIRTEGDHPSRVIRAGIRHSPDVIEREIVFSGCSSEWRRLPAAFTHSGSPPQRVDPHRLSALVDIDLALLRRLGHLRGCELICVYSRGCDLQISEEIPLRELFALIPVSLESPGPPVGGTPSDRAPDPWPRGASPGGTITIAAGNLPAYVPYMLLPARFTLRFADEITAIQISVGTLEFGSGAVIDLSAPLQKFPDPPSAQPPTNSQPSYGDVGHPGATGLDGRHGR